MPALITAEFDEALQLWLAWRRGFGWPYAGGWAEQPAAVFDVVAGFQDIYDREEAARRERKERERTLAGRR